MLEATTTRTETPDDSLVRASLELARRVEERLAETAPDEAEVSALLDDVTLGYGVNAPLSESADEILERGLRLCREEAWERGVAELLEVANAPDRPRELPGLFYSYLGYGVARSEGRLQQGLRLCRHAVEIEFYQPENFANLARTCLLAENRGAANEALDEGLRLDGNHPELVTLRSEMGARRPPVFPFLPRRNLLNRLLGQIRNDLLPRRAAA